MAELAIAYVWGFGAGVFVGVLIAAWMRSPADGGKEVVAWLRKDGMKAMPADEKEAWIEAGQPEIAADYTIPLYRTPGVEGRSNG